MTKIIKEINEKRKGRKGTGKVRLIEKNRCEGRKGGGKKRGKKGRVNFRFEGESGFIFSV